MDFSNKNVIVTGGASGIGKAVVQGIVAGGGHAVIFDINEESEKKVQEELGKDKVSIYKVNLMDTEEISSTVEKVYEDLGNVDVIINNAGIVSTKPFEEIDQKEWDKVIAINLTSVYAMTHAVFAKMKAAGKGRIVNIASVAAKRGGGLLGTSAYAVAREGAAYGVACNAVCPSYTLTPMTALMDDAKKEKILSTIPLKRGADPKEIANVILFYASDLASFVTGEISDVDGGVTMDG